MFESLFLYTGSNSRAGKTLKYELTYLFLRGLWLKQITECSFQEKLAIIYRHRGDTWTSTIYRRMNRDTRFTASRHMCRYIAIQPHVVSSKVSRYLGRDTIRVSRSHVSRCIDASMHRCIVTPLRISLYNKSVKSVNRISRSFFASCMLLKSSHTTFSPRVCY